VPNALCARCYFSNRHSKEITNMAVIIVELLKLGLRIRAARQSIGERQQGFARDWGIKTKKQIPPSFKPITFQDISGVREDLSGDWK